MRIAQRWSVAPGRISVIFTVRFSSGTLTYETRDYNCTIMRSRLRIRKVFWSVVVLTTLIQAPIISSQTSSRGQEPVQNTGTPTIKVTTRLVQVNVVVQNKKGRPVSDLTKDDF